MEKKVYFVGIDVDDKAYHLSIINNLGDKIAYGISCRRNPGRLAKTIRKHCPNGDIRTCYEATYIGYTLARSLHRLKLNCAVIAPHSIEKSSLEKVKNDRIDSLKLAEKLRQGSLKEIAIPSTDQEADRQLVRARAFLVRQRSSLKRHIINECRILDLDYKNDSGAKEYWTKSHRKWLDSKIKTLPASGHILLSTLLVQLESLNRQIETIDVELDHLSEQDHYKEKITALKCFKGISTITAMTIATEVFDINRFSHPRKLAAYVGLDIAEYSSGGKQIQYGITKFGNKHIRTALVESCQTFSVSKTPSKRLQLARKGARKELVAIADKCQARLYSKGHRLLAREKARNKVKVACARESIGFIWEALRLVS